MQVTFGHVFLGCDSRTCIRSFDRLWLCCHALFDVSRIRFYSITSTVAAGIEFALLSWWIMNVTLQKQQPKSEWNKNVCNTAKYSSLLYFNFLYFYQLYLFISIYQCTGKLMHFPWWSFETSGNLCWAFMIIIPQEKIAKYSWKLHDLCKYVCY